MQSIKQLLLDAGCPEDLFGHDPGIGEFALKNRFLKWLGIANTLWFEKCNLNDDDVIKSHRARTHWRDGQDQTRALDVLTHRGIVRSVFLSNHWLAHAVFDDFMNGVPRVTSANSTANIKQSMDLNTSRSW